VGTALGWFGDLIQALLKFLPRLTLIRETHRGVKFRHNGEAVLLLPGLRIWWPLIADVEVVAVARQSIDLPTQTLTAKDGIAVAASAVIVYEIRNPVKAYTTSWDFDSTVSDVARIAFRDYIIGHDMEVLLENVSKGDALLLKTIQAALKSYGVGVLQVGITDLVATRAISLFLPDGGRGKAAE
jgi:regulator of protease activity HflC (stomatin/prohibitin superfamily)